MSQDTCHLTSNLHVEATPVVVEVTVEFWPATLTAEDVVTIPPGTVVVTSAVIAPAAPDTAACFRKRANLADSEREHNKESHIAGGVSRKAHAEPQAKSKGDKEDDNEEDDPDRAKVPRLVFGGAGRPRSPRSPREERRLTPRPVWGGDRRGGGGRRCWRRSGRLDIGVVALSSRSQRMPPKRELAAREQTGLRGKGERLA